YPAVEDISEWLNFWGSILFCDSRYLRNLPRTLRNCSHPAEPNPIDAVSGHPGGAAITAAITAHDFGAKDDRAEYSISLKYWRILGHVRYASTYRCYHVIISGYCKSLSL